MSLQYPVVITGRSHAKTGVDISLRSEKIQGKGHLVLLAELKHSMVLYSPTSFFGRCGDHEIRQGTLLKCCGSRNVFFNSEGMRASKGLSFSRLFPMMITPPESVRKKSVYARKGSFQCGEDGITSR